MFNQHLVMTHRCINGCDVNVQIDISYSEYKHQAWYGTYVFLEIYNGLKFRISYIVYFLSFHILTFNFFYLNLHNVLSHKLLHFSTNSLCEYRKRCNDLENIPIKEGVLKYFLSLFVDILSYVKWQILGNDLIDDCYTSR